MKKTHFNKRKGVFKSMTLRELVLKLVKGLKKDYLSEKDKERLVEYILSNSNLTVYKDKLNLHSYSIFGVGEENKDRELPYYIDFALFYWGNAVEGEDLLGFNRRWSLETFSTFEELEDEILNFKQEGEYVVLVDGNIQPFKLEQKYNPFCQFEICWEGLKPYKISYTTEDNYIEEMFSSKSEIEKRMLELYSENGDKVDGKNRNIVIENIFDEEQYGYTLTGRTYMVDTRGIEEVREPSFVLHTGYPI